MTSSENLKYNIPLFYTCIKSRLTFSGFEMCNGRQIRLLLPHYRIVVEIRFKLHGFR